MQTDEALGCAETGCPSHLWQVPQTLQDRGFGAGDWLPPSDPNHPFLYTRALQSSFVDANQNDAWNGDLEEQDLAIFETWTQKWLPVYVPPQGTEEKPQDPRFGLTARPSPT